MYIRPSFLAASRLRAAIVLAALGLCVLAQFALPPQVSFFASEWLRDRYAQLRVEPLPDNRILVVDIDETSLRLIGPWPWPRARVAELVETLLMDYGARGVALDITFPEPADAAGDARLASLVEHGPVVTAQMFDYSDKRSQPLRIGALPPAQGQALPGAVPASGYIANHAGLKGARHAGNIGFIPDPDGALRRLPMATRFGGADYPSLALALANCCSGRAPLRLPDYGLQRVDFRRDWDAYTVASAAEILGPSIDARLQDRLVIIGSSSVTLADRVSTPLAANRPGVGVHATLLSSLLDHQEGRAPRPWPGRWLACLFVAVAAALTYWGFPRMSAVACVGLLAAMSAAWLGLGYPLSLHDPDVVLGAPLASLLMLLILAVPLQWQLTQQRSRQLVDTLRQYVAPGVVAELLRRDLNDPLSPRHAEVTTLIADMEGYTAQVEQLPVEDAGRLTRDFLECLTGPVVEAQGTLDKYTGDGLVAFWGAPLPQDEHADLALDAAAEIVRRVHALSVQRERLGRPRLRVRIGIESGPAMAGDFGTRFRSIYTAVGDSVNTAARLEQAAREFPYDIIIGTGTAARTRRHRLMELGIRRLRGKENAITLFTLDLSEGNVDVTGTTPAEPSA